MAADPDVRPATRDAAAACRTGVAGAALLAFALALLWALSVPAFWGVDETSHAAYAVAAAGGSWPTISTPNPVHELPGLAERLAYDVRLGREQRLDIWTANHPPLYFVLVGVPLRAGLALGMGGAGMLAARILTAAMGAAGVLAVGWLATTLAPRRPRTAVVAALCAALSPPLVHYAGQIYNDTLAFALTTAALAAGFAALRSGVSRRLLTVGAVAAAGAAMTRTSSLAIGAFVAAAFGLAAWFDLGGPVERRVRALVGTAGVVAGAVVALAGWTLAVGIARYGNPTAAGDLFEKFGRVDGPPWWYLMTRRSFAVEQVDRFASELSIGVWWPSPATRIVWAVLLAAVVGAVMAGARRRRAGTPITPRALWLAVLALGVPTVLVTASAVFVSQGGFLHSRYLLPGLGVLAILAAMGLEGLPGARHGYPALATLAALLAANIALWLHFRADHELWYQEVFPFASLPHLAPTTVAVIVALAAGLPAVFGLVRSITALSGAPSEEGPVSERGPLTGEGPAADRTAQAPDHQPSANRP